MVDLEHPDALVIPDDAPEAEEPTSRKKRRSSTSPTQRTLAECRKRGWTVQVVERWNPHARVRQDLFGVIDLVAILPTESPAMPSLKPGAILGIQACAGASHADRRDKILAEPRARQWVEAGGRLELWSWSKRGGRHVTRKLWTLRVEAFTVESWRAPFTGVDRTAAVESLQHVAEPLPAGEAIVRGIETIQRVEGRRDANLPAELVPDAIAMHLTRRTRA